MARGHLGLAARAWARLVTVLLLLLASAWPEARQATPPRSDLIDAGRLLDDLRTLAADEMQGRGTGTAGAAAARALISRRFREVGLQPVGDSFEHPFGVVPATRGINVVGRIVGRAHPNRYVVVSAHYDHVGVKDGRIFNGANDNASGAAALAVVAAHFVRHPPANSLLFVAFDAEEAGLRGSRAFVRSPPVPVDAIVANVNMDMIGRDADETLWITGVRRFPVFRPAATRLAASSPIRIRIGHDDPANREEEDWTRDSDQFAFIEAGIPALYIGVADYKFVHQPEDDVETMMPAFYVSAVEAVVNLLGDLDVDADALARARTAAR